jgi:hypothetical protein
MMMLIMIAKKVAAKKGQYVVFLLASGKIYIIMFAFVGLVGAKIE